MQAQQKRWFRGVGTLVGSIVGAGVFGLPYAFQQSGYIVGLVQLLFVAVVMIIIFLMYAEITVQTKGRHRFVTYMTRYLGARVKWFATILFLGGVAGGMVAYIIIGGTFLSQVVEITTGRPAFGGATFYSLLIAIVAGALIFKGLKFISKIEIWVVLGILILYGALIAVAIPSFDIANVTSVSTDVKSLFLPFGVVLFALAGLGAIPEVHDVLRVHKPLPGVLVTGLVIVTALYALFSFVIVGATGANTTQDVISGLATVVDSRIVLLGMVLGFISILSIYVQIGLQAMDTLHYDFDMKKHVAWGLTVGVPLLLFLLGVREFITVLGFVGTFFGGTMGILVVLAYENLKKSPACSRGTKCWKIPSWVSYLVIASFIFGMVIKILDGFL